jgi:hypothetical protein
MGPARGTVSGSGGRRPERSMRSVLVVVADKLPEHGIEMPAAQHQDPVQTLAAYSSHEALGEGVGSGRANGCEDDADAFTSKDGVKS